MQDVVITMDWFDYLFIRGLSYLPHLIIGTICLLGLLILYKAYIKK